MKGVLPEVGQCRVFNKRRRQHQKNNVKLSANELISLCRMLYLTVVSPKGVHGSADHAVCVVDVIVFDARLSRALKLCDETLMWVHGPKGVSKLGSVFVFAYPMESKRGDTSMRCGAIGSRCQNVHDIYILY
jgi:hypothetical protein